MISVAKLQIFPETQNFLPKNFGGSKKMCTFAPANQQYGGIAQLVRAHDS